MSDICQICILRILEENDFEPLYRDSWAINSVVYIYAEGRQFTFTGSSVDRELAKEILQQFGLEHEFEKLLKEECKC